MSAQKKTLVFNSVFLCFYSAFSVAVSIGFILVLCFSLSVFLCTVNVSAGTLEDIRTKTGWEPAVHSERNSAYYPFITPAELVAYLDRYHRNTIRMQVLFDRITTVGLNKWIGPKNNRHMWSSKRYIAFRIKDLQKKVRSDDIYLFLDKSSRDKETLFGLVPDTKITVTGFVKNIDNGKAWVEVNRIDLGWDR